MGGPLRETGDFNGVTLKLAPEAALRLVDSTTEPFQQFNQLYREQGELEEKLKVEKFQYQLTVESRLTIAELRQLTKLRLKKAAETGEQASRRSTLALSTGEDSGESSARPTAGRSQPQHRRGGHREAVRGRHLEQSAWLQVFRCGAGALSGIDGSNSFDLSQPGNLSTLRWSEIMRRLSA